ncbi:MAG: hypothetical protein ABUT20_55230 [Bacteroidota bacterium]
MSLPKLLFSLVAIFAFSFIGYSANAASVNLSAAVKNEPLPDDKDHMRRQLQWFAGLTLKDYESLRGKKLNMFEKFSFRINQRRAKQMLKHADWDEVTVWQKISWCFKGLILGPIALILGYIFLKDEERVLIKWIWFGFAGWCAVLALILLAA